MGIKSLSPDKHVITYQVGHGRLSRKSKQLTYSGSLEEAIEIYDTLRGITGGKRIDASLPVISLSQFAPQYLSFCADLKEIKNRKNLVALIIKTFGDHTLNVINPRLVESWQADMVKSGLSPATVNRRVICLKHMIHKAVDWDICPASVHEALRKVKQKKEPMNRLRFLTREEADRLLERCDYWSRSPRALAPHQIAAHLRPIVEIALNTGMRLSEILKLKWADVDSRNGLIRVLDAKNGERRDIPMNVR